MLALSVAMVRAQDMTISPPPPPPPTDPTPTTAPPTTTPPPTPPTTPPVTTTPPPTLPTTPPVTTTPPPSSPPPGSASGSSSSSGSHSGSHSKSSSSSSSGSGSSTPLPTTQRVTRTPSPRPTTKRPVASSGSSDDTSSIYTPFPSNSSNSTDVSNERGSSGPNKLIVIIVAAGIAGVCMLGLIVICLLRRSREELDDLTSPLPLPQYGNRPLSFGSGGDTQRTSRGSIELGPVPTGPGAANYYRDSSKLRVNTSLGVDMNGGSMGITSPGLPAHHRPTYRYSRQSRASTFNSRMSNHIRNSELSSFSVRSDSDRGGSEISSIDVGRKTYDSRISSDTEPARFTANSNSYRYSNASSLYGESLYGDTSSRDGSTSIAPTSARSTQASRAGGQNWYNAVPSPKSSDRYTGASEAPSRASSDRQSFEL
ncbi:hypothetical protein Poli38472_014394 [Pythium oligandrum]|uniref:Uncharacterized protein n=1 Tax=Pythium oligandrum TaxID=41045 RepID=A0A8K1C7E0_PYTOL|nr:hypothetical protein Poli38472_014394 [Pythium oligandrum]|eukprot:TMW57791.1 hypothetical protein Poli38472_014394 [Pythium oligandrum]